jgi:hypothetical protein
VQKKIGQDINEHDYSSDLESLQIEIEKSKEEYIKIIDKLVKGKKALLKYRNSREDLIISISEINDDKRSMDKYIKKIVKHECPQCHSVIQDNLDMRVSFYSSIEDIMYMKAEIEENLSNIERKITLEETRYSEQLELLRIYENKVNLNNKEIEDVLKYKGYVKIRESIVKELGELQLEIHTKEEELIGPCKTKKKYDEAKKKVNEKFKELMIADKYRFGLEEIDENKIVDIKSNIIAGGSNKPIATVICYMNLLKLRKQFNPDAIIFPIVLDSPNNVETDDEKRIELLQYLFDVVDKDAQLIVSNLGFDNAEFLNEEIDSVMELMNDKYELLSEDDYKEYISLYVLLMGNEDEQEYV